MADRTRNYALWIAIALVVLYVGATYYHATYTPILQAAPALVLLILCAYIFWTARADMPMGTAR